MFGHHSLSETSFATDAIDLFFTPTGVSGTGATFASDHTVSSQSILSILGEYENTGSSTVLGNDGLEFTIAKAQAAILDAKALFGVDFDEVTATSQLNNSLSKDGILYQGQSTDIFLETVLAGRPTSSLFDELNSFSVILNLNTKDNPLFGAMVTSLGSFQTTNIGVEAISEIGRVLVWGIVEISQDPSYTNITPNQTASYSQVQPNQTPSYSEVEPSQTPNHTNIIPSQTPTWSS